MAIFIIWAEISLVILVFSLVNWLVSKIFKQLIKIPILSNAQTLRRNIKAVLLLCCFFLCVTIVGVNAFLIYQGENLQEYTLLLIRRIPSAFWVTIGIASLQSLGLLIVATLLNKLADYLLKRACIRAKNWEKSTADDESIVAFFGSFNRIVTTSIWLSTLIWCTQFFQVQETAIEYLFILLRIYLIVSIGLLIFKLVAVVVDSLDILSLKYSSPDNLLRFYDRLRNLVPFLKRCLETTVYVLMATLVVQQIELIADFAFWGSRIIKLIAVIFVSHVFVELAYLAVEELLLKNKNITELQRQRRLTIIPLLQSFTKYIIYFSAGILILEIFTIDPAPILAAAGLVGLAASLGAQNLINDLVSGFFILFENYYLVGDYIAAGNVEEREIEGFVEAIELRTTRVRHPNGQLQIIRNGEMGSIVNYSKNYIYAMVQVRLNYEVELERVYKIIESIGEHLKANYPEVLEPTQVDGIEEFGEYYLLLGTRTKVKPGRNLQIERLFRKMLKDAFNREEIQIPVRTHE
ncbi:small-conductance mechanosensitive channel [Rivularia sp. PCC 7116]|uniref:mechanosensitive ion channel family protein n=1 Tax=Rivularia sp. PCC 7116 TaxID=373994 RepID=UPI00029EEE48|nr:mechanosensitive ion channel family protein [Rivularia sp. PCC 7116]AFY52929.1 small-conductance mechanosensitive channel [Rivularia sp. PCC 7116]